MSLNENLRKAKRQKNDEFYTQRSDIENELRHYTEHFRGKVVYCNCDDPSVSNFFHFFPLRQLRSPGPEEAHHRVLQEPGTRPVQPSRFGAGDMARIQGKREGRQGARRRGYWNP